MSGIDDVKRNLADWCAIAAERTTEAAKVTSRRYDRFALGREIERRYADLGALVHAGLNEGRLDVLDDPRVAALRAEVEDLEHERRQKEAEIDDIRRQSARRREPAAAAESDSANGSDGGVGGVGGEPGDRRPDFSD
ncbi:MAG: hypothetical protein IPK64_07980 [bacterium]|nr:hypothetical protein [bacterium]